ncbi:MULTISPECIES: DUF4235 domain-containing protein [Nocardia]|uniref:DUF4235 domain-containing protein n=1 Tax=Nocardia aurea TaxID=2144174 RepID=A0ABV3FT79_9NOCA|nr:MULTISPECIES: DUF4235 domain-containing protein [Nocardia]
MKTLYKPLGMIVGVLGGVIANAAFSRVWRSATGADHAPTATAKDYGWREVLIAAAVQGAIFGLVKAAVDRAGAAGYQSLTGTWPE